MWFLTLDTQQRYGLVQTCRRMTSPSTSFPNGGRLPTAGRQRAVVRTGTVSRLVILCRLSPTQPPGGRLPTFHSKLKRVNGLTHAHLRVLDKVFSPSYNGDVVSH